MPLTIFLFNNNNTAKHYLISAYVTCLQQVRLNLEMSEGKPLEIAGMGYFTGQGREGMFLTPIQHC